MKKCTKCGKLKSKSEFSLHGKGPDKRRGDCKSCRCDYMIIKYSERQAFVENIKAEKGCVHCGEKRPYVLDFHHIDSTVKEVGVSRMVSNAWSIKRILNEIDKCIVLCANCHREVHYLENRSEEEGIEPSKCQLQKLEC